MEQKIVIVVVPLNKRLPLLLILVLVKVTDKPREQADACYPGFVTLP